MTHKIAGVFQDFDSASKAIVDLNHTSFTEDITVIAKDKENGEITAHQINEGSGILGGAVIGAVFGCMLGLLVAVVATVIPGIGASVIVGPFAGLWAVVGAAFGGLAGSLIGGIVTEKDTADHEVINSYEKNVNEGNILVIASTDHKNEGRIKRILNKYNVFNAVTSHRVAI